MANSKKGRRSNSGFTLIELMIVIIIVSVLMAVALPAYQNQVIRGHRSAAKGEMLELANREQQFLLANRTYTNTAADFAYTLPADVAARYSFDISTVSASGIPFFEITFTALGAQTKDGWLSINSEGTKASQYPDKWER